MPIPGAGPTSGATTMPQPPQPPQPPQQPPLTTSIKSKFPFQGISPGIKELFPAPPGGPAQLPTLLTLLSGNKPNPSADYRLRNRPI